MAISQGLQGRLNFRNQGSQLDQVREPKRGPPRGNNKERVLGLEAGPARRHGFYTAEGVPKKKQVIAPMDPPLDAVNCFSEQGMKGVCYSDRGGYFSGATCS